MNSCAQIFRKYPHLYKKINVDNKVRFRYLDVRRLCLVEVSIGKGPASHPYRILRDREG